MLHQDELSAAQSLEPKRLKAIFGCKTTYCTSMRLLYSDFLPSIFALCWVKNVYSDNGSSSSHL